MDDDDRALIDKVANATHFDLLPIEDRFAWGGLFIPHGRRHERRARRRGGARG